MWKQAQYLEMKENLVLSLQKYPFTRRSDEEKKRIKELGPDRPYFQFVCTPQIFLAPATGLKCQFFEIEMYTSSESWINKLSIDAWFVRIGQYLADIQLF